MAIVGSVRPNKTWTATEVERLIALGALENPGRYELIEGELKEKMGQGVPHIVATQETVEALRLVFESGFTVVSQAPVKGDQRSEPEPDVAVYGMARREFKLLGPLRERLVLAVEVSDTTLPDDQGVKAALYARFGVQEYWLVNLRNRTLEVRREPKDGEWRRLRTYGEEESVAPLAVPDRPVAVADLLPLA